MAVKGGKEIIALLNEVLAAELAAINQYFLHAKMHENWGYLKLFAKVHEESIDEMKHANELIARILYLDGIPNVQKLGRIRIGEDVEETFRADMALELDAIPRLNDGVRLCQEHGDNGSRALLEKILVDEEVHLDWLETQLHLIETLGIKAYCAEQM